MRTPVLARFAGRYPRGKEEQNDIKQAHHEEGFLIHLYAAIVVEVYGAQQALAG